VFVNPVSVLTPGILRRIFEPVQPRERQTQQREAQTPRRESGGSHLFNPSGSTPLAPDPSAPAVDVATATP
jgi:hypothetical protein